jgi:hypothetical protein
MNERIKELWDQAVERHGGGKTGLAYFAELIVRECARVIDRGNGELSTIAETAWCNGCRDDILKHFGVEERKGWVCSKCGVDRIQDVCPHGDTAALTGECPMTGKALLGINQ